MSLGQFRAAPREGHLERLKHLIGYIKKRPHAAIRFRTDVPMHEEVFGYEPVKYDWMEPSVTVVRLMGNVWLKIIR
jgi:hypothetical protein